LKKIKFRYLSGFNTPDASIAVDLSTEYSILFLRRKSSSELTFDGGYPDFEGLIYLYLFVFFDFP